MEVGPLQECLVGYASGREEFKEVVDSALSKITSSSRSIVLSL